MLRIHQLTSIVLLVLVPASHAFLGPLSRSVSLETTTTTTSTPKYRIRQTQEQDLSDIASMLSTAIISDSTSPWSWKTKLDRMFAKADIEALLRQRLQALQTAKKHYHNLKGIDIDEPDRLKLLWSNDRLRTQIEKASTQTGEQNLWKQHNFAITPPREYLNHLQLTAEDTTTTGQVLGFVEVAQLSNPTEGFSPAITNLATSPAFRRRGIASRLLKSAERFTIRYWKADSLGLYVEQSNKAALALYKRAGFEIVTECEGGDVLGNMYYMSKQLQGSRKLEHEMAGERTR